LPTWTPTALTAETRRLAGACWRVVESQHMVPTMKIVDTLAEQARLEELLEESKPAVPADCRHLHYLLFTPFRYGAPYPHGSRLRRAGATPGVFYASQTVATAITETAFARLLFFGNSPATPWPTNPLDRTAFQVRFRTTRGLDLIAEPFNRDRARWTDPTDYAGCQDLAEAARVAGVQVIRYASARDPRGVNIALLTCAAFNVAAPLAQQTWHLHLDGRGVRAFCTDPEQRIEFDRAFFAGDPRIAALRWER
jgi:hypothetical protein